MNVFEHADLWSDYEEDREPLRRIPLPIASTALLPHAWRYRTTRPRLRRLLVALGLAAGVHVIVLFAFNGKDEVVKSASDDEGVIELMVMPDMSKLEEPEITDATEPAESAPLEGSFVPTQADVPTVVDVSTAFVQQIDFSSLQPKTDLSQAKVVSIPTTIRRGGTGSGTGLKDVFNLAQLDRIPEAIFQPPPVFPVSLKKEVSSARVEVEFVVTAKGEVVEVRVISATHSGFESAAVAGVSRWQFRPGMKGGKKVNTRMRVPLLFRVVDPD
jgi:TonB family protein